MAELAGQVALVTGASSGIGRHLAEGLAARGATVVGLARTRARLVGAMQEVEAATGARTLALAHDVSDPGISLLTALEEAGVDRIDLLVNNAGLVDAAEVPVWEADPDQWWEVVTSHIRGAFLVTRAVVPGMVARGRGRVVNLASGMSVRGRSEYSAYSVAKTGLMRFTETLTGALEGTGVVAFDLSPGVVDTAMTRSMPVWEGYTDWTPPEQVVEFVAAIAAGRLDRWTGRYLRVGHDDVAVLEGMTPEEGVRQLRLRPYGDDDPLA